MEDGKTRDLELGLVKSWGFNFDYSGVFNLDFVFIVEPHKIQFPTVVGIATYLIIFYFVFDAEYSTCSASSSEKLFVIRCQWPTKKKKIFRQMRYLSINHAKRNKKKRKKKTRKFRQR